MTSANPAPSPSSQARRRRGFNLIEAAIVLGVVGVVIGGIWVAAAKLRSEQQLTDLQKAIKLTIQNIQSKMPIQLWPVDAAVDGTTINATIIAAGWVPQNIIKNGQIINPIRGNQILITLIHPPTFSGYTIRVEYSPRNGAEANAILARALQGQKTIISNAYCWGSVPWIYDPPATVSWPPNCPTDSTSARVYYLVNSL